MAVWSVVNRSYLRESIRIDAEYHKPDDLALEEKLVEKGFVFLKGYLSGFCSGKNLPQYGRDGGNVVPFIRTQNVRPFLISDDGISYCRYTKSAAVETGDILAVRVGAGVGDFSIVAGSHSCSCISDNVLRIRVSGINPFFLVTFLASSYGQQFFRKTQKGTARGLISRENFYFVPIPDIPIEEQQVFEELIKRAEIIRLESASSFEQAQSLLESELGLDKLTFDKPVSYAARFSEVTASHRLDAQHFYPYFDAITASLPNGVKLEPLSKFLVACARGKQPAYSDSSQAKVVNSKHVLVNKVVLDDNRYAILQRDVIRPRAGDVLMNGTGVGTIGRAAPLMSEEPVVLDNHVTLLRVQGIDPVFLSVYLNSAIGQAQVEKHLRGSSGQIELYPADIRKFMVWNAPEELQKEIRNLIESALTVEQESKRLLEQAKHRVEALIEEAIAA